MNRPKCKICGKDCTSKGRSKNGIPQWKVYCSTCDQQIKRSGYAYGQHKKSFCEYCNFVAIDPCQLDIDHIDGNRHNNEITNLRTLCANCHRLKSFSNT